MLFHLIFLYLLHLSTQKHVFISNRGHDIADTTKLIVSNFFQALKRAKELNFPKEEALVLLFTKG